MHLRQSSLSLLSFAALASSVAEGSNIPVGVFSDTGSGPSSRRSSLQPSSAAASSSGSHSRSASSAISSSGSHSRSASATLSASHGRPTFKTEIFQSVAEGSSRVESSTAEPNLAAGVPLVAAVDGRPVIKTRRPPIKTIVPVTSTLLTAGSSAVPTLSSPAIPSTSASSVTSTFPSINTQSSGLPGLEVNNAAKAQVTMTRSLSAPGASVTSLTGALLSSTSTTRSSSISLPASSGRASLAISAGVSSPSNRLTTALPSPSALATLTTSKGALSSGKAASTGAPYSLTVTTVMGKSSTSSRATSVSAVPSATYAPIVDMGCWYDTSDNRTFVGPSVTDAHMTRETCSSFCTSHGMQWSGTEYGAECYCSASAPTANQAWWCNMPCGGNGNEICGSGNAMSVSYAASSVNSVGPATTYTSDEGCYADAAAMRTLSGPSLVSDAMTNSMCSTFCAAQQYAFSGTEYGSQCYCGNVLPWSAPVSCSMPCAGDSSQVCGDGNALSVMRTGYVSTASGSISSSSANATASEGKLVTAVNLAQKFDQWSSWKARGVNLGNWLVLEEWMDESWFDSTAPGAVDEWTFCQTLGTAKCQSVLQNHWQTWINATDIANMATMGVNTLRIPIGYWAFVDPQAGEPYIRSTQLQQVARVLTYAASYGMTVVLDLHGLPGSQNGKDHSGHQGNVQFWTTANQARSLQVVQAAASWIASNNYAGIISALEVANEPAIPDWTTWLQYKDYVIASHKIIQQTIPSVATMFHDGFWPMQPWNQFFTSTDNVVIDTHKYWAFSPTTFEQATSDVCNYVSTFAQMNFPVFVGEFSLSVQGDPASFAQQAVPFFESQMAVWLQSAGAAFWSLKVFNSDGNGQNTAWSAEGIRESGILSGVDVWQLKQNVC